MADLNSETWHLRWKEERPNPIEEDGDPILVDLYEDFDDDDTAVTRAQELKTSSTAQHLHLIRVIKTFIEVPIPEPK